MMKKRSKMLVMLLSAVLCTNLEADMTLTQAVEVKDLVEDKNKEQTWASCAKLRLRSSLKLDQLYLV